MYLQCSFGSSAAMPKYWTTKLNLYMDLTYNMLNFLDMWGSRRPLNYVMTAAKLILLNSFVPAIWSAIDESSLNSELLHTKSEPLLFFVGIFFVLPCIESYQKVDLRTITLGVPPQEVGHSLGLYPVPSILQFILPPLLDIVVSFSSHWLRPEWARHRSVVKTFFSCPLPKIK